jgi:hypothetical protein
VARYGEFLRKPQRLRRKGEKEKRRKGEKEKNTLPPPLLFSLSP